MNILMICGHGDQRMIKESLALKYKGHRVSLLTRSVNSYTEYFDEILIFNSDEQLAKYISYLEADIYHVHCKPAPIPANVVRVLQERKKKFVYDVHDLDIVRFEKTNVEELYALLNCPYLIFPDKGVEERAFEYLLKNLVNKPKCLSLLPYFSLVDMLYPLIQTNIHLARDRAKKIVYEGNVVVPAVENIRAFPYYDYRFTSHIFSSYGFEFHIYPVGIPFDQARQFYDGSSATLHYPVEYPQLVKEMSQFGWGIFGSFSKNVQQDNTFANKIFDYICSGLPVVVMNSARMGKWLEETGFGFQIKTFDDIEKLKNLDVRAKCEQNVLGERDKYSMEAHIGELEQFYEMVLNDNESFGIDYVEANKEIKEIYEKESVSVMDNRNDGKANVEELLKVCQL